MKRSELKSQETTVIRFEVLEVKALEQNQLIHVDF